MFIKLAGFEIKKLFSMGFVKLFLGALLALNVILCFVFIQENSPALLPSYKYFPEIFAMYEKDPAFFFSEYDRIQRETEEAWSMGRNPPNIYVGDDSLDLVVFQEVLRVIHSDESYHREIENVIEQAKAYKEHYLSLPRGENRFYVSYQSQIIERYSFLDQAVKIENRSLRGWEEYFTYRTEAFPVIILLTLYAVYLGAGDHRNGSYTVTGACRYGRRTAVVSKVLALSALSAGTCLLFALTSFSTVGAVVGYSNPSNAVQAISGFSLYPFHLNLLNGALLSLGMKLIVGVSYALVIFALSAAIKRFLAGFLMSGGIVAVNLWIDSSSSVLWGQEKNLNLFSLYSPNGFLLRYRAIELFGFSVDLFLLILVLIPVFLILLTLFSCFVYGKGKRIFRIRPKKALSFARIFSRVKTRPHPSVTFYELYKQRLTLLALLILIVVKLLTSFNYFSWEDRSFDRLYKEYLVTVGGTYTQEKEAYIENQLLHYEAIVSDYDQMQMDYWDQKVSQKEFDRFMEQYVGAEARVRVLTQLKDRSQYLSALYRNRGVLGSYVYEEGWNRYAFRGVDWTLFAGVCLLAAQLCFVERNKTPSGGSPLVLLQTTPKGRTALFRKKFGILMTATLLLWVLFSAIDLLVWNHYHQAPDMNALLVSVPLYQNAPVSLTFSQALWGSIAASLVGICTLSLLCLTGATLMGKVLPFCCTFVLIGLLPHFALFCGIELCAYFDPLLLTDPHLLFRTSWNAFHSSFYAVSVLLIAALLALGTLVFCVKKINRGVKI